MLRKIIQIDQHKCNGCGICATACHEGAIQMVNGKAKLMSDEYCDGLGDCLPTCPTDAITMVEREATPFSKEAVDAKIKAKATGMSTSQLKDWPIQLDLVNPNASFLQGANLLLAADCTAFSYGNFHNDFIKDHVVIIACPKLAAMNIEKLTEIFATNDIQSLQVVRMEVPCCGGIVYAAETALKNSGKDIPLKIVTITLDGQKR